MPFAGFTKPNYTQVPNEFLDDLLRDLNGAEVKVALAIFRKTFGFQKHSDDISLTQLVDLTGCAKSTVSLALDSLIVAGILARRPNTKGKGSATTTYEVRFACTDGQYTDGQDTPQESTENRTQVYRESEPQKKEIKGDGVDLETLYEKVKIELLAGSSKQNYETYIRDTRLSYYDGRQATIQAPTEQMAEWLSTRWESVIVRAFEKAHQTRPKLKIVSNGHA